MRVMAVELGREPHHVHDAFHAPLIEKSVQPVHHRDGLLLVAADRRPVNPGAVSAASVGAACCLAAATSEQPPRQPTAAASSTVAVQQGEQQQLQQAGAYWGLRGGRVMGAARGVGY